MQRVVFTLSVVLCPSIVVAEESKNIPDSRTFLFTYKVKLLNLPKDKQVNLWLPAPSTTTEQTIKLAYNHIHGKWKIHRDKEYGNRIIHIVPKEISKDGSFEATISWKVTRKEVKGGDMTMAKNLKKYLQPNRNVPVDGKPLSLIKSIDLPVDPMNKMKTLYNVVFNHMTYDKTGIGWGRGDSSWACDSGKGNCTDFHSLFLSLTRAQKIPGKFEIGFPLPADKKEGTIGGYHCWAKFYIKGKGWIPVDISEADKDPTMKDYYFGNLTPDRVAFSTGRDINLVPKQQGKSLNYFIYPYAEVDGKPLSRENIQKSFSFKDTK